MRKAIAAALAAALGSSPAAAAGFSAGVSQAFGRDKYEGTNVYAAGEWGGLTLAPEYRRYSREAVGPVQALSARVGYDARWAGAGATAGKVLRSKGYDASFAGADAAVTLSPGGETGIRRIGGPGRASAPVGKGLARLDLGGGVLSTVHSQDGASGGPRQKLTQHEIHAFAGASVLGLLLSARGARFRYSDDLKRRASLPSAAWTPLAGHAPYYNGYADTTVHVRGEFTALPMVRPSASYTFTRYAELASGRPADTRAYGASIAVGLELLAVEGGYQYIDVARGGRDSSYLTLGATLRL